MVPGLWPGEELRYAAHILCIGMSSISHQLLIHKTQCLQFRVHICLMKSMVYFLQAGHGWLLELATKKYHL